MKGSYFLIGSIVATSVLALAVFSCIFPRSAHRDEDVEYLTRLQRESDRLDSRLAEMKLYTLQRERVVQDLCEGRITFHDAVEAFRQFHRSPLSRLNCYHPGEDVCSEEFAYRLLMVRVLKRLGNDPAKQMARLVELRQGS